MGKYFWNVLWVSGLAYILSNNTECEETYTTGSQEEAIEMVWLYFLEALICLYIWFKVLKLGMGHFISLTLPVCFFKFEPNYKMDGTENL